MLSNIAVVALAAIGSVNAGPLNRRQATSAVESAVSSAASAASSAVESAATSVASSASSAASDATSMASSAASDATSMASSMASGASSSVSSAASAASSAATTSGGAATGNATNPAYPCPPGFLLTYAAVNQTVMMPVTMVTAAVGEWASSPLFPNVTMAMGGNDAGATHTINVGEISLPEILVSYVANETSGSGIWTWNGSLPAPVTAMGVQLSNYSTVLQIYDPDYTTTQMIGNTTFINLFTNACATPQAEAMQLLMTLGGLELSNAAAALSGGNSTMPMSSAAMESSMPMSSMAMSSAESAMSSVESATSSAASGASSAASSATSAASSAASGAASSAESAASGVTSAAASAASSAAAAVTSTSA